MLAIIMLIWLVFAAPTPLPRAQLSPPDACVGTTAFYQQLTGITLQMDTPLSGFAFGMPPNSPAPSGRLLLTANPEAFVWKEQSVLPVVGDRNVSSAPKKIDSVAQQSVLIQHRGYKTERCVRWEGPHCCAAHPIAGVQPSPPISFPLIV